MGDERSASEMDRQIGRRMRARRIEIGMSQAELAEKLGITFQQIQKYESGTNRIAATRLYFAASELGVCPLFLLTGTTGGEGATTSSDAIAMLSTPEGGRLAKAFAGVTDPQVRKKLVGLVLAVAQDGQIAARAP